MRHLTSTAHHWPQVGRYPSGPLARWPHGIAVATIAASALLSACGGDGCIDAADCADDAPPAASQPAPSLQPVDCTTRPELCA